MADDRELRVDLQVTGADEGATALDEFADAAERVEDLPADLAVDVEVDTRDAVRDVDNLADDLTKLDAEKVTPTVDVQVDDDALRRARTKVDDLGGAGSGAGRKFGSNFASETGSVLNEEAAGIAGDFGGAFETGLAAVGIDDALGGAIAGGVGIGVLALSALWAEVDKEAKKAEERLAAAQTVQRALAAGKVLDASEAFFAENADLVARAERAGVDLSGVVDFVKGLPNADVEDFIRLTEEMNAATLATGGRLSGAAEDLGTLATKLREARTAGLGAAESITEQDRRTIAFLRSQKATTAEWIAFAQTAGPGAKRAVAEYVAEVEGIPEKAVTDVLLRNDPNALAEVERQIEVVTAAREVRIRFQAEWDRSITSFVAAGGKLVPLGSSFSGPAPQVNFTINAGFGTDAYAVAQAVLAVSRDAARLQQGAARYSPSTLGRVR